ncbi:pilus assembly protein [Photobacterium sp. SDRW27]|uniref:TadE/TadG family type IV pilus assembly protein n=1 Tax=Photobacterium obscurum TaxID=2829490 RepID=UPI0022435E6A|nr:TadE/TadG family type IV pilus assembly protein [Photobacterium obscurum]MCW8327423.1 pilus assembly protein [Photobacterium obscurum]
MKSLRKQKGVFSIEFALGAIVLFMTTFAVFEICRFIYIVNLTETALRESARDTRLYEKQQSNLDYQQRFQQMFKQQSTLWHYLVAPKRCNLEIDYYQSYSDLVNSNKVPSCNDCPLAQYTVTYRYIPAMRIPGITERTIKRSMLMVQEHEGWDKENEK